MSVDRFPQIMTITSANIGAVDDFVVTVASLPMSRMASRSGMTIAMEILRVDWYLNMSDVANTASGNFAYLTSATRRASADAANFSDSDNDVQLARTFAFVLEHASITTSGAVHTRMPISVCLNDGAGNGFLYVGDTITMVGANAGTGTATTGNFTAKILYRWVQVKTSELMGVLTSQQAVVT